MKILVAVGAAAVLCWCSPAAAQIKVPYFNELSNDAVCGGINSYCQPNSSLNYERMKGVDFGELNEWLGTSYGSTPFERSLCVVPFDIDTDLHIRGEQSFEATFNKNYEGGIRSVLKVDVAKYLSAVLAVLPMGLQAKLKADATDKLSTSSSGKANFVYRRYDLKMAAMSRLLPDCYKKTQGKKKVITGVSVITMSGNWARSRLVDSFGAFEKTADFIGLTSDVKAAYIDKRDSAINGTFQPLSLVIAVAWRKKD